MSTSNASPSQIARTVSIALLSVGLTFGVSTLPVAAQHGGGGGHAGGGFSGGGGRASGFSSGGGFRSGGSAPASGAYRGGVASGNSAGNYGAAAHFAGSRPGSAYGYANRPNYASRPGYQSGYQSGNRSGARPDYVRGGRLNSGIGSGRRNVDVYNERSMNRRSSSYGGGNRLRYRYGNWGYGNWGGYPGWYGLGFYGFPNDLDYDGYDPYYGLNSDYVDQGYYPADNGIPDDGGQGGGQGYAPAYADPSGQQPDNQLNEQRPPPPPDAATPGAATAPDSTPPQGQESDARRAPYSGARSGFPGLSYDPEQDAPDFTVETVTLVFKDGRPREQIHNYMLSRSTLLILDGRRQEIPVDQLDMAATAQVNRQAGVDFRLPGYGR